MSDFIGKSKGISHSPKQICEPSKCTGCYACYNICTHRAIKMVEGKRGFLYPLVDLTCCLDCGRCSKVCPGNNPSMCITPRKVYAALVKNDKERAKSSSGGLFACIAQCVVKNQGYVFGAVLDKDLTVRHKMVSDYQGIELLRKSKYLQSEIGDSYCLAKEKLEEGKEVLFSGTPCQIAALKNFLGKKYNNLFLIDILCHGVPSPMIYRRYIDSEERRASRRLIDIQFRSKTIGWRRNVTIRRFTDGFVADWVDTFVPGFLSDLFLRDSCYKCNYATENRQGDISLGDYWGYSETKPEYIENDDKGISLVICNSQKGADLLRRVKHKVAFAERTMEDAKNGNKVLYEPIEKPDNYDAFWEDYLNLTWEQISSKYGFHQDTRDWMSAEDRAYFDKPYARRHLRHVLSVKKREFLTIIRGEII